MLSAEQIVRGGAGPSKESFARCGDRVSAYAALLATPTPETFAAVCDALADAADAGEEVDRVRFLDAVDRAQNLAVASGLVRTIGQDAVQWIMGQVFKRCRVHQRPAAEPPPPQYDEAAGSTVEALMFSLRERGAAALLEPACLDCLAGLSSDQIRHVIARLIALRSRYPIVTNELLSKLEAQA
jgi:hypothetical protein